MTNALRHAHASRIDVSLQSGTDALALEIADNGQGQAAQLEARGHYGVPGMRERAQALGGRFAIEQVPDGGVRVRVRLPLVRAGAEAGQGAQNA